jgi:hypothetical protein
MPRPKIPWTWHKIKRAATFAAAFLETFLWTGLGSLRFLFGRSRIRSVNCSPLGVASFACGELAMAFLRVCALEVKTKFRRVRKEKTRSHRLKHFLLQSEAGNRPLINSATSALRKRTPDLSFRGRVCRGICFFPWFCEKQIPRCARDDIQEGRVCRSLVESRQQGVSKR